MNSIRCTGIFFVCGLIMWCEGITNNEEETNLIGEEERRGVNLKKEVKFLHQGKAPTQKRGLWIIGQANPHTYPSGYDSTYGENGYNEHIGSGYGITNTGYGYTNDGYGDAEEYQRRPGEFPHGAIATNYGYNGGGFNHGGHFGGFGHTGGGHDISNYGESHGAGGHISNYGESHGSDIYKKIALKKLLIPLAGLAILGAAAALSSSNPVLLQLGTVSGRRRRSLGTTHHDVYPSNPLVKPNFIK